MIGEGKEEGEKEGKGEGKVKGKGKGTGKRRWKEESLRKVIVIVMTCGDIMSLAYRCHELIFRLWPIDYGLAYNDGVVS